MWHKLGNPFIQNLLYCTVSPECTYGFNEVPASDSTSEWARNPNWAIPCQRSEKKAQRRKVDFFFIEMWKTIGQIDDFDRFLNNSCNLGVFLAQNKKYPKMSVLKKCKLKKRRRKKLKIKKLMSNIIYNILIVWILWFLLICFVICNVLGNFYLFSDFHVFQYCEKCVPLNANPLSTF